MPNRLLVSLALLGLAGCSQSVDDAEVVAYLKDQPPAVRDRLVREAEGHPETTGAIHRGDVALTLIGKPLEVGAPMPDAQLVDGQLATIELGALRGKLIVLSVVPSIDTRVCEAQTHRVSDAIGRMPAGTEVFTISRDLPFAQTRFAEDAVTLTKMASDYHTRSFGRAFGLEVKETGLLARSVWVIGKDGKIAYRELVGDQQDEPSYDGLLAAIERAGGG